MTEFYVEGKNGKLFVKDEGKGIPLLFIHGWLLSHEIFEHQFNALTLQGFRCLGVDLRGFGISDQEGEFSYDAFADDIQTVLESLSLDNVMLVGHSMGGAIALQYLARYECQRVKKLFLVAPAAPFLIKTAVNRWIKLVQRKNRKVLLEEFAKVFFRNKPSDSNVLDKFYSIGMKASSVAIEKCLFELRDRDLSDHLSKIHIPTSIFHAIDDVVCPTVLSKTLHKEIKHSQFIQFNLSGHGLFYEEKEKFNRELIKAVLA